MSNSITEVKLKYTVEKTLWFHESEYYVSANAQKLFYKLLEDIAKKYPTNTDFGFRIDEFTKMLSEKDWYKKYLLDLVLELCYLVQDDESFRSDAINCASALFKEFLNEERYPRTKDDEALALELMHEYVKEFEISDEFCDLKPFLVIFSELVDRKDLGFALYAKLKFEESMENYRNNDHYICAYNEAKKRAGLG